MISNFSWMFDVFFMGKYQSTVVASFIAIIDTQEITQMAIPLKSGRKIRGESTLSPNVDLMSIQHP